MTGFPFDLVTGDVVDTITAYNAEASRPVYMANSFHPNFNEIVAGLRAGDPNVWTLFDVKDGVLSRFYQISDRYAWDGGEITFDGDPVHSTFTDLLSRALETGDSRAYTAIARFGEKLATNPDDDSRAQAYDWLASHQFQITDDGDVVGYKGVYIDGDGFTSTATSRVRGKPSAFVNGLAIPELSKVPQNLGDVISMPRSEVVHNPHMTCERGLHISTRSYAEGFGHKVLVVFVNPRDIVSVPHGAGGEKVRCCRYRVSHVASDDLTNDHSAPVLRQNKSTYTWAGDVSYKV